MKFRKVTYKQGCITCIIAAFLALVSSALLIVLTFWQALNKLW